MRQHIFNVINLETNSMLKWKNLQNRDKKSAFKKLVKEKNFTKRKRDEITENL